MGALAAVAEAGFAIGDSSNPTQTTLIQAQTEWLDASEWENGVFKASVSYVKAAGTLTLDLYTAGEWDESGGYTGGPHLLQSFGTISSRNQYKIAVVPETGDWPIEKYVFWKVTASGTAGDYQAFFRIDGLFRRRFQSLAIPAGRTEGPMGARLTGLPIPATETSTRQGSRNSVPILDQLEFAKMVLAST